MKYMDKKCCQSTSSTKIKRLLHFSLSHLSDRLSLVYIYCGGGFRVLRTSERLPEPKSERLPPRTPVERMVGVGGWRSGCGGGERR